jgi:protein SCO1/2
MTFAARIIALSALAVAAAAAGVAAGVWYTYSDEATVRNATVLDVPRPLPEFQLIDEHGAASSRADLEGHWTVLFFGFTHCPDVCPMTLQALARALRSLDDLPPGRRPTARFVTVDPERDTPEQLAHYLGFFDADMHGLPGDIAEVDALTRALGVAYSRVEEADADDYTMDHTAALFLVDPAARLHAVFTPPFDVRSLAADLRAITRRAAS